MVANLNEVKRFFDPHPGFAGAAISIPTAVRKVAAKLDGKRMSLRKAIDKIQAVTRGTISVEDGWIALELRESGYITHMFQVIRFR